MSQTQSTAAPAGLSTELSEFLVELSIALHRTTMYPPGHPSQEKSAAGVMLRVNALLKDRASVSVGVARRQLVIEGVATDPRHPLLCSLAEKLHKQHIGAVVFNRGITTAEMTSMMHIVAAAAEQNERPLGLADVDALRQWQNVRLYALTYDQLELIGDPSADDEQEDEQREQGTRSAQLWIGLARAALTSDSKTEPETTDPSAVAKAINEHRHAQAYDQVVVGYLLQISRELKHDGGHASAAVKKRMSRLIGALDPATLERLVQMGGDFNQRKQFVLDASESLAVDAVVDIVRAAAETSGQTISNSMMRMLSKLSAFADQGSKLMQEQADSAVREQVRELMQDWKLQDPNPDAYTLALQSMSTAKVGEQTTDETYAPEPIRLVQMALEVESLGVPFWRAVAALEQNGGLAELIETLQAVSPENLVASELWAHLATERNIRHLLSREPIDFNVVSALLEQFGESVGTAILLDTIVESESRSTRMGVFRRLVSMGPAIAPALLARLSDERWYVKRNMLAILNEMRHVPERFAPADYARHPDARVRREALSLWLRLPGERDRAVIAALKDADDRTFRIGINAALEAGVPEASLPLISAKLSDKNVATDIRLQLLRILGAVNNPLVVDSLLKIVVTGKTLLGAPRFAETTPVLLVALTTLAERWPHDARVKPILERARAAKDADITAVLQKVKTR